MSELDEIVQVTVTVEGRTPERAGFGVPLIAGYFPTTVFAERVRSYRTAAAMVVDGFPANHPLVRAANVLKSQSPSPPLFKVGRRASAPTQTVQLVPTETTQGLVVGLEVVSPDGTVTTISRTNGASETVATIVTALQALLDAITGLTATNVGPGTHVSCAADTAGDLFDYRAIQGGLEILDATADPGIAADLTVIRAADADWYGLALDSNSKAELAAAAAWAEAETLLLIGTSADEEVLDDTAGNIAETLNGQGYHRTALLWNRRVLSYAGAAWLGAMLPKDPGQATWAFKTLVGVTADALTATQIANLEANKANHYTRRAGLDITRQGTAASGRFLDVQRTVDAVTARIQEALVGLVVQNDKLPYTDEGVGNATAAVLGVLREFQQDGALDPSVEPTVSFPRVADVPLADRQNRNLPDGEFQARIAGAVHSIAIEGRLVF